MDSQYLIVFELVLVFGLVLGFCGWELWSLRRERQRDRQARRRDGDDASAD
ncbi:MAG: hypothetical protein MUE49_09760 [Rhodospirillales bacterium]|jgi:hypothetical protein|nr:hypothetical protein [Rhodospirillales bacterium]